MFSSHVHKKPGLFVFFIADLDLLKQAQIVVNTREATFYLRQKCFSNRKYRQTGAENKQE